MLALNEKLNEKFEGFFNEVIEGGVLTDKEKSCSYSYSSYCNR
ncbi:hypothetical protein ACT7DE_19820 [Bacillus paranthracis]